MENETKCPCCSGKLYRECCQPCHEGHLASNALALMRSRYSAYALQKSDYIIATTHPSNPSYLENHQKWKEAIAAFCNNTSFEKLEIVNFKDGDSKAEVTFIAHLRQGNRNATFKEISLFEKLENQWLYKEGIVVA